MATNTPSEINGSDPTVLRQIERQNSALQARSIATPPSVSGTTGTNTTTTAGAVRNLAPIVSGSETLYPQSTTATSNNAVTINSSINNDTGDVTTVYSTNGRITVNPINQTINQYTSVDSGVSQIVAGNGVTISSTGASGTGVVTISSSTTFGNIVNVNLNGNANSVLRGDGTWGADANSSYGNSNVVSLLASFGSNTITTTGNVSVGNISATNLGNVSAVNLDGNASNVLRGDGSFGPDANSSYGDSNVVSLLGSFGSNTITTTGLITGNGAGLTNLAGANVSGFVANANVANTAYAVAAANVSGLGNVALVNLDGNSSNVLRGDGTFSADANSSYGDSNVVSLLGSFGSNTITTTGNVSAGNISATNLGNISSINLDGSNSNVLYGNGAFAAVPATAPAGSNGEIQFNISGAFASTANLTFIDGISGGTLEIGPPGAMQLDGNGTIVASNLSSAGNVYVSAGNGVVDLRATGNIVLKSDNANYEWVFTDDGNLTLPANTVAIKFANGSSAFGNIVSVTLDGNSSNVLRGDGTFSADANSSYGDSNVVSLLGAFGSNTISTTGNVSAGNVSATDVSGTTLGGTLTTAAQPNVTSVGTLTGLTVDGSNVTLANGVYVGNGSGLTSLAGANVSGEVAFAATANAVSLANVSGVGNIASVNLDGNVSNVLTGNGTFVALPVINANTLIWTTAPGANNSTGNAGEVAYDAGGNFYVCTASNTWSKFTGNIAW